MSELLSTGVRVGAQDKVARDVKRFLLSRGLLWCVLSGRLCSIRFVPVYFEAAIAVGNRPAFNATSRSLKRKQWYKTESIFSIWAPFFLKSRAKESLNPLLPQKQLGEIGEKYDRKTTSKTDRFWHEFWGIHCIILSLVRKHDKAHIWLL